MCAVLYVLVARVIRREIQVVYHIWLRPSTYKTVTFMNQNEQGPLLSVDFDLG